MTSWSRYLAVMFGAAFAFGGMGASAQQASPAVALEQPAGWANSRSDLPQDRDYTLGVLPNGMRYLILPSKNPPNQVAMRMVVDVGSMHEKAGQEGLAHFLEHLAFRGTKQLPDGEIQRRLEALGLQMGSDANATTYADHTSFMLDMPRNDAASLETALLIFREIASELTLAQDMINAERGVVLSEERLRATEETEASMGSLRLQVGAHPYARDVVGKRQVIETATSDQVRAFYDAFYRPERTTLIVVGDVAPANVAGLIQAKFGGWTGRGTAGQTPAPVLAKPASADVASFVASAAPDGVIEMYWFEPYRQPPPTKAERRRVLVEQLGQTALAQRMRGLNEAAGRPARAVSSPGPSRIDRVWNGQFGRAVGVRDVAAAVTLMVKAQRQAAEFGVTADEFERAKELRLEDARNAVALGRTLDSSNEAEAIVDRMTDDPVFVSRRDALALMEEQIKTITLEEVNAAIQARLSGRPTVLYRGPPRPDASEATLRTAFDAAMAAEISPYAAEAVKPWPYTSFGAAGKVVERRTVADLGVTFVKFANGVKLAVKPMPVLGDQVFIEARLGLGRLGMPRDRLDASDMGQAVWSMGGLGKLTTAEQARTLAGKRVSVSVSSDEDAFAVSSGATPRGALALQMQLLAAQVSDPGFRTDEWDTYMASSAASEEAVPFSAGRVLQFNFDRLIHSDDPRWTYNTTEMRKGWKAEDAVAFIRPIVATAPIDVVIVGGVDVEAAIQETAKTFGALPPRKETAEPKGIREATFPAHTAEPVVLKHKGRADQAYAIVAWPTGAGFYGDTRSARAGYVLADMLRDEATRQLRTGSGSTYSPITLSEFSFELPAYGYIGVQIEAPPAMLDGIIAQVEGIAAELAAYPVPRSEVTRITGPSIEQAKRSQAASPGYWMANLALALKDRGKLDAVRSEVEEYQSLTPADIHAAAKRWLKPETVWKLKVVRE